MINIFNKLEFISIMLKIIITCKNVLSLYNLKVLNQNLISDFVKNINFIISKNYLISKYLQWYS